MAILDDLIAQISDAELRNRISKEVGKLTSKKKFGLVYEEHIPECTPLVDAKIKKGQTIALKDGKINDLYIVKSISSDEVVASHRVDNAETVFNIDDVVAVAQFGEPIYPYLKPIDSVKNAPDDDLWHTLIEADNYHALQLLAYLYPHQVDCIYIDPPYNTGARDWKYNNDYVDSSDAYRHSKWLSMMEKRLKLAKQLLNPEDSVLIVTIDEKEYLHLGMLLEEMFPEARIQMISVSIHASGVARAEFSRTDEYYYYVFLGDASPNALVLGDEWKADGVKRQSNVRWESMLRSGVGGRRKDSPNLFFPVLFYKNGELAGFGDPLPLDMETKDYFPPNGTIPVFPYASDGSEARWRISANRAKELIEVGAFDWTFKGKNTTLRYLKQGELKKVTDGEYTVVGYKNNGAMIISSDGYQSKWIPGTQWHVTTHQAGGNGGSILIKDILNTKRFDYPKSVYAVRDSLQFIVSNKPNALIVDFFAGSGTTLHAVNLLNAEDGGHRKCIMVTNNEVSDEEAKLLSKQGYKPGDEEWEKLGIARYVTWPRTVCSIEGHDVNGNPLKGNYLGSDLPMSEGFKANAAYFKLGFLSKENVSLGRQFRELLPLLWLKAGSHNECPKLKQGAIPDMLIFPENKFAVLVNEVAFMEFEKAVNKIPEIETVYIITDSQAGYREMISHLKAERTYQLYRDYLDNFRINAGR